MQFFTFCIHVSTPSSYMISGIVDFDEPFHKLFNQGMITGKNGIKMSKSKWKCRITGRSGKRLWM